MKGKQVIARGYGGKVLVKRIWDFDARAVYIVSDEKFQALTAGSPGVEPPMVGFPREDVFKFDPKWLKTSGDWALLSRWESNEH